MKNPRQILTVAILFIIAVIFITLSSCSQQKELFVCDNTNRVIVGYTKNMKRYLTIDGCGRYAGKLRNYDTVPDSIGTILYLKEFYKYYTP